MLISEAVKNSVRLIESFATPTQAKTCKVIGYYDNVAKETYINELNNAGISDIFETVQPLSENVTSSHLKRTDEILSIEWLYIDVDLSLENIKENNAEISLFREYIYGEMCANLFNRLIPMPTKVVSTGVGMHLVYKINQEQDKQMYDLIAREMAGITNSFLCDLLGTEHGRLAKADMGTAKLSHYLYRVIGTRNSKTGTYAKIVTSNEENHSFNDIINEYCTNLIDYNPAEANLNAHIQENEYIPYNEGQTVQSFARGRLMDLERVQSSYNSQNINEGYRERLLFIYAQTLRIYEHNSSALHIKINGFNDNYNVPLPYTEVNSIYKQAWQTDKPYKFHTFNLIKEFNVTWAQQRQMLTLIGKEEKYRRKQEKRKRETITRKSYKIFREKMEATKIVSMMYAGATQTQISKELGIPVRTLQRRIQRYAKEGHLNE